jgi:excinuclease ABC subunit C
MKDAAGEVIYVGKAKALKNRVTSYFRGEHLPKVAAMVEKVSDFDVIVASSEFEALVLENSLIKRHRPRYNILLKDDKGYPFIRLDTKSEYPSFTLSGSTAKDGARYFGPFGGRGLSYDIIDTICKALLLPTCSRKFPRDIGKSRPCLNYPMGVCAGWCTKDSDPNEYRAAIGHAAMILGGQTRELTEELKARMLEASETMRFELAASLRDRIRAIEGLSNRQRVIAAVYSDTDAVGFHRGAKTCFSVLHFVDGDLAGKDFE